MIRTNDKPQRRVTRRRFISTAGSAAFAFAIVKPAAVRGTQANSRITNKIWQRLDAVDGGKITKLMAKGDYLETWKFIEHHIFSLK